MLARNNAYWRGLSVGLGLLGIAFPAARSHAVPVLPGAVAVALPGTDPWLRPELAGAIVRQALLPYTIRDGAGKLLSHGQVEEIVLWSPLTRSYHFLFRVMNFWDSPMAITRVVRGGFGAFATDADWRRDYPLNRLLNFAPAPHPTTAVRPWPQNVAFDFRTFPVAPQWSSRYVFVATNARAIGPGGTLQLFAGNGAGSTTIPVFRPL